jgi:hypothetical protein
MIVGFIEVLFRPSQRSEYVINFGSGRPGPTSVIGKERSMIKKARKKEK